MVGPGDEAMTYTLTLTDRGHDLVMTGLTSPQVQAILDGISKADPLGVRFTFLIHREG